MGSGISKDTSKLDRILRKLTGIAADMTTVKRDLSDVKKTVHSHTKSLDGFARLKQTVDAEQAANRSAHLRFDARDEAFAGKVGVDLNAIDVGMAPRTSKDSAAV